MLCCSPGVPRPSGDSDLDPSPPAAAATLSRTHLVSTLSVVADKEAQLRPDSRKPSGSRQLNPDVGDGFDYLMTHDGGRPSYADSAFGDLLRQLETHYEKESKAVRRLELENAALRSELTHARSVGSTSSDKERAQKQPAAASSRIAGGPAPKALGSRGVLPAKMSGNWDTSKAILEDNSAASGSSDMAEVPRSISADFNNKAWQTGPSAIVGIKTRENSGGNHSSKGVVAPDPILPVSSPAGVSGAGVEVGVPMENVENSGSCGHQGRFSKQESLKSDGGQKRDSTRGGLISSIRSRLTDGFLTATRRSTGTVSTPLQGEKEEEAGDEVEQRDSLPQSEVSSPSTRGAVNKDVSKLLIHNQLEHGKDEKDSCMISPVSKFRLTWDSIAFSCLLLDLWFTPLELVFMAEDIVPQTFIMVNYGIIFFFVVDIILNFFTGFIERDKLVMKRRSSIRKYMTGWFWVDIIATVPYDLILGSILEAVDGDYLSMARLTKAAKVFKTLRFLKMVRAVKLVQNMGQAKAFVDVFAPLDYLFKLGQTLVFISLLAHVHGCLWAALQEDLRFAPDLTEAYRNYYLSFKWAFNLFTLGYAAPAINTGMMVWTLEMVLASERILIASIFGAWGIIKAMTVFQEDVQMTLVKNAAMKFFRLHAVSVETQIQVMYSLHETRAAQLMQRHFKQLMSEHLPDELRRTVSEELWVPHLLTMGLIEQVQSWHTDFLAELSLVVREEVIASKTILCKEGSPSVAAYFVISGRLACVGSHFRGTVNDFTDGTWVGEQSFISPARRRNGTFVARILTRLMAVPADHFHEVISRLGLQKKFAILVETRLEHGLCGRCGDIGDHFTHVCPNVGTIILGRIPTNASGRRNRVVRTGSDGGLLADGEVEGGPIPLASFLHAHRLSSLQSTLETFGVTSLEELEVLPLEKVMDHLEGNEELLDQVDMLRALLDEKKEMRALQAEDDDIAGQHLIFLSHFKLEAGTEAALMRQELEAALKSDDGPFADTFTNPIFLDSEDLFDLAELRNRVQQSHNLVLLLTHRVLSRPWVLVELVTAIGAGVRVLPVQVFKTGDQFVFPDDQWFTDLLEGRILDKGAADFLRQEGIEAVHVEKTLREVFKKIALPYSPHRPGSIRQAEVRNLIKNCRVMGRDGDWLQVMSTMDRPNNRFQDASDNPLSLSRTESESVRLYGAAKQASNNISPSTRRKTRVETE